MSAGQMKRGFVRLLILTKPLFIWPALIFS